MSTFSSVVRKPGQKITPKTAPRRNVQRNTTRPAAPVSLASEDQNAPAAQAVTQDETLTQSKSANDGQTVAEKHTAAESATVTRNENAQENQPPARDRTVTPVVEHVDHSTQRQETSQVLSASEPPAPPQTVLESTETPRSTDAESRSLPLPTPIETPARSSPEAPTDTLDAAPVAAVEVIAPSTASQDVLIIHPVHTSASPGRADAIPTIATSATSSAPRRRLTNELTPAPSEPSFHGVDNRLEGTGLSPERSRKRQKTTHPGQDTEEAQSRVTPPLSDSIAVLLRSSPRHRRSESRTSDALLQDATNQAAAVSELAHSIEDSTRSLRPPSARPAGPLTQTESPDGNVSEAEASAPMKPKRTRKKQQRAHAIQDLARQVVDNAVGRTGRGGSRRLSRLPTPEDAEEQQIDPEEVSMGDLVRDNKIGKKSETEKKMQENWEDIKRRRQEEIERRREAAAQRHGKHALNVTQDIPVEQNQAHVPQQIIVNGQIVVAAESREVAFGAGVEQAVIEDADVALEDDRIYKYVHQGTLGKHAGRRRGTRWDDDQTELFYKGLRMFGTDFSMIANLFPSLDRKQIKLKYIAEERAHPARVKRSVATKEPVDLDEYARLTNQQFEDPDALQAELDAEEKRLREADERRRTNEGYVLDGADVPLPSTERDDELADGVTGDGPGSTQDTGDAAAVLAHRRKQTQPRRKEAVGRGRQAKKGRIPMEGVEERIGPIEEVYQ